MMAYAHTIVFKVSFFSCTFISNGSSLFLMIGMLSVNPFRLNRMSNMIQ